MERAGLLWTAVLGGLLVCAGGGACSDKKSAIMLAVTTDMKAPKDVNAVSVTVSTNNNVKHNVIGRVTPEGEVLLPATLAIVEPEDPNASVRIRVMAFQERKARVLRDVRTSIPSGGRVALLRIPLNFVNDGSTIGEIPANVLPAPNPGTSSSSGSSSGSSSSGGVDGGLLDGGSSSGTVGSSGDPNASSSSGAAAGGDSFDPFVFVPNCPNPEDTWIDGECKDAYVDPSTLPDFDESQVGRGDQEGACFDVAKCFANASPIGDGARGGDAAPVAPDAGRTDGKDFQPQAITLDRTSCSLQLNGADAAKLNLAIVTPETGECIRPGACYIPLDSGPGGWRAENGQVKLPGFVCKLITSKNLQLHHSVGCDAKKESSPICLEKAPNSSGGSISATLVLPDDYPNALHYYDDRRLVVAGQKRVALLDISGAVASTTDLAGFAAGERLPWGIDEVGGLDGPAIALTNGTNQGWLLLGNSGDPPATVALPGPGISAAATGAGGEGFYLWAIGGPGGGLAQSPPSGGAATKLEAAFPEQVTAIAESSGTVVVGDLNGGVRMCNGIDGVCKQRNAIVPGRIDVIKLFFSDGIALGGDGIYRSRVVDLATGAITGTPVAVPARVTGPMIDGRYFRHDLFPLGEQCVVFTSEDGVEMAAGDKRRVLVPIDGASGRRALGIHVAPKLGSGGEQGKPPTPVVYFAVFAPREQGGGVYAVDVPPECAPRGGDADAGDDSQCHDLGQDCTDGILPCCEGECVQEADRKVCRLQQ